MALVAAVVTGLVVRALVAATDFDARSTVAPGLGPLWSAAMVARAVTAIVVQRRVRPDRSRIAVALLAGVAAGLVMAPLMAGLHGTDQPPYTIARGDMEFRTEYVTRLASTWHLDDYTFRGLSAFYPPAWFWAAGRTAHVLGVVPWRIMAPFTIVTIGVALLVAYTLWRAVLTPAGALAAAIATSLVLPTQVGPIRPPLQFTTQGWYSSYSCFVAVTGIAWLAATAVAVRRREARGRLAVLTVVGAVLALTYYLLFALLVLVLAAVVAIPPAGRREALRRVAAVCGAIAVLTAVFWIPLLSAVVNGNAAQGHFVSPAFLRVSVGLGGPLALGVLAILAALVLMLGRSATPTRAVAGALIGAIVYQGVSILSLVLFHNQLQPHRAVTMMWAAFGAAVPVALDRLGVRVPPRLAAGVAAVALAAIFTLGAAEGTDLASGPLTAAAYERPHLKLANYLSDFIEQTTGKRPHQLTIASGSRVLLTTRPYYGFLPLRARYAHPEARVPERIALLRRAATCPDAACTTRALGERRFGPIDALVLRRTTAGYRLGTEEDFFPVPRRVAIYFRRASFDPAVWAARDIGVYTVFD